VEKHQLAMRIALVMPPFASANLPSLGLTQLKARLASQLGARVAVSVHYLNHDFAALCGAERYEACSFSTAVYHTGFGDWFFRQVAFPELDDNRDAYLQRHFRHASRDRDLVVGLIDDARAGLDAWLDQVIARHQLDQAELVGFTSMFAQTVAGIAVARKLKEKNPKVVVTFGGPACELPMGRELAAHVPCIDYVFSGSALVSFPAAVSALLDGEPERIARIPGVVARAGRGVARLPTVDGCAAELPEELSLEEPLELDYHDFLASYRTHISKHDAPVLMFETSRGCWWGAIRHCTFCGLNGSTMAHREMSADRALAQFAALFERHPDTTCYGAVDNILPLSYLDQVLPRLRPPEGVAIFYEVKSNLDEDQVRVMAESGVRVVQPGIESLSTTVLKLMQKGVSAFQNLRFLKYCLQHDVYPEWYVMIGFPGEPEEVYPKYLRDLPLLSHLPPPYSVNPVRFDRFSPYHLKAKEYGLELEPFDFYGFIYPFDRATLHNLAYHFMTHDPRLYVPMARWRPKLQQAVDHWRDRYLGSDGQARAELYRDGHDVVDTRSGRLVRHQLSEAEAAVLARLDAPRTAESIDAPAAIIDSLRAKGLLFEEDGRLLDLVLPNQAPPSSFKRAGPWSPDGSRARGNLL
jgi:ribosomal peptide maturation radical SAM protein 1